MAAAQAVPDLIGWSADRACSSRPFVGLVVVGCVKALYDRPLTTTNGMVPTGRGRVTDLLPARC